ncbi:uncharacterized protein LOC130778568 [Actinidia eriantha]|uniref:uncharacterized protein LOC130778568 n=1 Tax=Actinidia eriantha TaxID=165200 RepID=UPI002589C268|nr:uncharacterized protein LOC130778568 [Actinidia eriantha]
MEEKPELSTQATITTEEEDGVGDEEFYEKIEAPKFVDFTAPDPYRPDDRYWFCLRVGCDQKHEEEIDPEAISKNFVLRVMAARSPYIKLRQILNRKASSVNEKCPLSAPSKPSKSRVSRLAVISSFSQKMVDGKRKAKPLSKLTSTPNAKGKQVAARYLTTPRNKKCLPNPNAFRSVQNPKITSIAVPKNRTVAKALVFHSPKKAIGIKTSVELRTPLTKICKGMKKLEINGQRKRVLGYSNKLSKEIRCDPNKSLPVEPARRQISACKDKNKAKELFRPPNCKGKETKSLRHIKRKSKGNTEKACNSVPKETVENDSSTMEIDTKSREGSLLSDSRVTEGNLYEEQLTTEETSGSFDSADFTKEQAIPCVEVVPSPKNSNAVLPDASRGDMNPSSISEGCLEQNAFSEFQENSKEGKKTSEGIDHVEKTKSSSEKRESLEDDKIESQTLGGGGHEGETMDSDDKENALASDGNRDFDHNTHHSGRLGKTKEIAKKVARAQEKTLKEGLTVASAGAQGVKYRKPKSTNPKPFRLRTDERGILKEANLERRIQPVVPQKETAAVIAVPGGIMHKKHGNEIQRNGKCLEQSKCNHDTHETSGNEEKILQKDEPEESRRAAIRTPVGQARPKTSAITPQRRSNSTLQKPKPVTSRLVCGSDVMSQKSENNLRKTKSPSLQRQVIISPKGVASTGKNIGSNLKCATQLTVIKETSAANKATASASRSLLRGKRPATIPKEPNFHGVHVPKTCTRKVT